MLCSLCWTLSLFSVLWFSPMHWSLSEQQNRSVYLIWECNSVGLILISGHRILLPFLSLTFHFILIKCATDFQELEKGLSIHQLAWEVSSGRQTKRDLCRSRLGKCSTEVQWKRSWAANSDVCVGIAQNVVRLCHAEECRLDPWCPLRSGCSSDEIKD